MKKVLVTGESGYIGMKFKEWIENNKDKEIVLEYVSVRDDSWKNKDFSHYDSVLHLAGIAHVSRNSKLKELYYNINSKLSIELAQKAKQDKVKQFIFMSSIIVYGDQKRIDEKSIPKPKDFYGDSKLKAEHLLNSLSNDEFKIAIIRPPMVYGEGAKGNYKKLSLLSKKIPLFPLFLNKRSMIYIDNLCEFIKMIIKNEDEGIFFPQNTQFVSTSNLVNEISNVNGKKMRLIKINFKIMNLLIKLFPYLNKIFGDLYYDHSLSKYSNEYNIFDFKESINKTENNNRRK